MRILITGANGFIGSRLCREFLARQWTVIAGVRKTADLSLLDGLSVEFRYGDVAKPETLPDMVRDVDCIVHNAGLVKAKNRETFFRVNHGGTVNMLDAVVEHNPSLRKFLYISSLAAAGPSRGRRPIRESDPPAPLTLYGESKLAGEMAVKAYADRINVVAVRPPGVYGPGDKEILTFFKTVSRGFRPHLGDVSRKIQLVHVDDLCRGVFAAMTSETDSGSVYFIAENRAYTMKELIDLLSAACGRRGVVLPLPGALFRLIAAVSEIGGRMIGMTPMLTRKKADELLASWEVDTGRAHNDLGFTSTIDFARGARETCEWYRREGWLK